MKMRSLVGAAFCAGALTLAAAVPAFAGEVTGNGKPTQAPAHASSICAFSGLNDTYSGDPDVPDDEGFTRTQNWGQIDKETKEFLKSIGSHPGGACRGNLEESPEP